MNDPGDRAAPLTFYDVATDQLQVVTQAHVDRWLNIIQVLGAFRQDLGVLMESSRKELIKLAESK